MNSNNIQLVLIRGLPGSGKSTKVREILINGIENVVKGFNHFEADMFFDHSGKYKFDIKFLKNAHAWCFNNTLYKLLHNENVIVSNTFTTYREMEQYLQLVNRIPNLEINVISMKGQYTSIHNIPEDVMQKMKLRWENNNIISKSLQADHSSTDNINFSIII